MNFIPQNPFKPWQTIETRDTKEAMHGPSFFVMKNFQQSDLKNMPEKLPLLEKEVLSRIRNNFGRDPKKYARHEWTSIRPPIK